MGSRGKGKRNRTSGQNMVAQDIRLLDKRRQNWQVASVGISRLPKDRLLMCPK